MGYDCSITKRKGCNYCLRRKTIEHNDTEITIDDESRVVEINNIYVEFYVEIDINYCPICGKKL